MSAVPTAERDRLARLRENYADELAGLALFTGLAEHADDGRREQFLALAASERRHADHWARLLRESGEEPRTPRTPGVRVRRPW